jgi:hypothetical protein
MAYVSKELKAKLATGIKAVLKKYGVKGTIAVNNHSTLVVNIKQGAIDFAADCTGNDYHYQVNTYHIDRGWTGKAAEFLNELVAAMKGTEWYDRSDIMTDYFDTAYYMDVNIGRWDREYECTQMMEAA